MINKEMNPRAINDVLNNVPPWPWKPVFKDEFIGWSRDAIIYLLGEVAKIPPPVSNEHVLDGCEPFSSSVKPARILEEGLR